VSFSLSRHEQIGLNESGVSVNDCSWQRNELYKENSHKLPQLVCEGNNEVCVYDELFLWGKNGMTRVHWNRIAPVLLLLWCFVLSWHVDRELLSNRGILVLIFFSFFYFLFFFCFFYTYFQSHFIVAKLSFTKIIGNHSSINMYFIWLVTWPVVKKVMKKII